MPLRGLLFYIQLWLLARLNMGDRHMEQDLGHPLGRAAMTRGETSILSNNVRNYIKDETGGSSAFDLLIGSQGSETSQNEHHLDI